MSFQIIGKNMGTVSLTWTRLSLQLPLSDIMGITPRRAVAAKQNVFMVQNFTVFTYLIVIGNAQKHIQFFKKSKNTN